MLSRAETSNRREPNPPAFGVVHRQLDERTCVIAVEGELDLAGAPRLKWMLIEALEAGCSQLVVDLSRTTFMDSTALGVLIGVNRSLDVGTRLAIACAQGHVVRIFEISGMDGTFAIFETVDDALADLRGQAARAG
jgi:anti-sigma B factor antagonist